MQIQSTTADGTSGDSVNVKVPSASTRSSFFLYKMLLECHSSRHKARPHRSLQWLHSKNTAGEQQYFRAESNYKNRERWSFSLKPEPFH